MPLNLMKQLALPGLRALRGATRVEGRPGLWKIDPAELSESAWLSHAAKKAEQEAELAARPGGVPSMTGAERARVGYMLQGALGSMRQAAMLPKNKAAKGLVNVDRSGRVNAAAATDLKKAETYLADPDSLDFTATYPQYLEYVATNTPEVRGSDLMRLLQDEYGPEMVFQVYNPRKNKAIYENMGARPMPKTSEGLDILEGHEGLPAYELNRRIPERGAEPVDPRQLDLPGFKDGGVFNFAKESRKQRARDDRMERLKTQTNSPRLTEGGASKADPELLSNALAMSTLVGAGMTSVPFGGLQQIGKWVAKQIPGTLAFEAGANIGDANASFIGSKAIPKTILDYFLKNERAGALPRALAEDTANKFGLPVYRFPWKRTNGVFAEVPDNESKILWDNFERNPNLNYEDYLEDALHHDKLYSLVPKLRHIWATLDEIPGKKVGTRGSFRRDIDFPGEGEITVGADKSLIPSVLNHEVNHAVQMLTGLPSGTNKERVGAMLAAKSSPPMLESLARSPFFYADSRNHKLYELAIGEQFARKSAERMGLSLSDLVKYPPVFDTRGWSPSVYQTGTIKRAAGGLVRMKECHCG